MKKIASTVYLLLFLFFVYSNCSAVESLYSWTGNEAVDTTSSTTTTIGEECMVTVDPKSPIIIPGGTVQFFVDTECGGVGVFGTYTWEVHSAPGSTIAGSTIDANGLYRAGNQEGEDTVTVTDVDNGNIKDSAKVTVSQSVTTTTISEECVVTIDPKAPIILPGGTVQFFADTECGGMEVFGTYTWEVHSVPGSTIAGSTIDANGLYRAGNQEGEDTVTVTDVDNGNIKDSAKVTVSQSVTTTTTPNDGTTTTTVDPDEEDICPINLIVGAHSEKAELLRYFRDNVLSQTREGQEIIKLYYQLSPVIVKKMKEDEIFKEEMKGIINGVIKLIYE